MGCGGSQLANVYHRDGVTEHQHLFEGLAFKEMDIARLHKIYRVIDNDNSGEIEMAELLAFLDLEKTRFTKRIFSIFDEDGSGLIDFREFVMSLWNYCTLTKASLTMFAFDLYDKDQSGSIDASEVIDMLHDLYGKEFKKNPNARMVERELEIMHEADGCVDIEDFREFSRTHPALLFHAFRMQEQIQNCVLGPVFWAYYSERRIEISRGRLYVPVSEFIALHIDNKLKTAVLSKNIGLGQDPREAVGYVPDADGAPPAGMRKFQGKLSTQATDILAATGSMARRKGTEVPKIDAATRKARADRRASVAADKAAGIIREQDGHGGTLTDFAIDEAGALIYADPSDISDRSFEGKVSEMDLPAVKWDPRVDPPAKSSHRESSKSKRRSFDNAGYGMNSKSKNVVGYAPISSGQGNVSSAGPTTREQAIAAVNAAAAAGDYSALMQMSGQGQGQGGGALGMGGKSRRGSTQRRSFDSQQGYSSKR